jgi:hypothetical protein
LTFFDTAEDREKAKKKASPRALQLRAAARPIRTRWAERMAPLLGKHTQDVLAKEEADRYRALEKRVNDLATGWAELRKVADAQITNTAARATKAQQEQIDKAALAAAEIGVWRPLDPNTAIGKKVHTPFAPVIVEAAAKAEAKIDAKVEAAIAQAQKQRRLRFL